MSLNTNILDSIPDASQIIDAIKCNDKNVIKTLYLDNYYKVESLIVNNNGNKEQAKDIFQEAFIAVWKNVKNDKFIPENKTAINGYLYTIAKNKWMDYLGSSTYKKTISYAHISEIKEVEVDPHEGEESKEHQLSIVMKAFQSLGDSCQDLLKKFYFEKKSMNEIAAELKLDAASTRNKKYRCMQTLRELSMNLNT